MANGMYFPKFASKAKFKFRCLKRIWIFSPDFFSLFQNMHKYTYLSFSNLVIKNEIFLFPLTLTILVLY